MGSLLTMIDARSRPFVQSAVFAGFASFTALMLPTGTASATELEPDEFVTAPPGTTALISYFVYGDHQSYQPAGGPTDSRNTHLDDFLGIARAATYFDVGGVEMLVEFLQPFGTYTNASIGGTHYPGSSGAGDTTVALAVWPINDTASRTYLGVTLYLVLPDGAYDRSATINLGGNRLVYDPELAFHKGFDEHWSFDLSGDFIAYGDNTAPSSIASQTLSQDPTLQLQGFLNYTWANKLETSIGYESEFGGRESLNGAATGAKTEFEEVRLVASYPVATAFQMLGEVNHQFSNTRGFRQDVGVTVRTLYAF